MTRSEHVYEVRQRKDHRGVDLISDALSFGRRAKRSQQCNRLREVSHRSHDALIRIYDEARNVIKTREHACDFREV